MQDAYFIVRKPKTREIMLTLEERDGQSANEIVSKIGSKTTTFYRIKDLVAMGFLRRLVQQDANRTTVYFLTPNGRKWVRALHFLTEVGKEADIENRGESQ